MIGELDIDELWSLKIKASDLYNIERTRADRPATGGGHTYIQIPTSVVDDTLKFLGETYPPNGVPLIVTVHNRAQPDLPGEPLEFRSKSGGRMRIARQNRHLHHRLHAWSPESGFPVLEANRKTADARKLLNSIGGLRIYLARAADGTVWAGYTKGSPSEREARLPFAKYLWGSTQGGYWRYEEPKK